MFLNIASKENDRISSPKYTDCKSPKLVIILLVSSCYYFGARGNCFCCLFFCLLEAYNVRAGSEHSLPRRGNNLITTTHFVLCQLYREAICKQVNNCYTFVVIHMKISRIALFNGTRVEQHFSVDIFSICLLGLFLAQETLALRSNVNSYK